MTSTPRYPPAVQPTMYFVGVSTGQSSIMQIFPRWAAYLGLGDSVIRGVDLPLHAAPGAYREIVSFLKADPLSRGALVTTHKIDLFRHCRDLFDFVDPLAALTGEVSSLSKSANGGLAGHAKDPISSGLTLDGFLPPHHWESTGAEVFAMGAGGATIAITWHLLQPGHGDNRPRRIVVSDRREERLEEIRRLHVGMNPGVPVDYVLTRNAADHDAVLDGLRPGSLVINATGLGKDRPGSPLTAAARFPERGIVWELNYRGELEFLRQARAQQTTRGLQVEDGWTYFLHGWTRVIAEVFHLEIPTAGPRFEQLSALARASGQPAAPAS